MLRLMSCKASAVFGQGEKAHIRSTTNDNCLPDIIHMYDHRKNMILRLQVFHQMIRNNCNRIISLQTFKTFLYCVTKSLFITSRNH